MVDLEKFMHLAIDEARTSLREGNSGFGAVIAGSGGVIARAHDTDTTTGDPTAHAEMTVIRTAAGRLGGDLSGCMLVATHEPCPMCSTAMLWSGISGLTYGYSIKEAIAQGRKRVDLSPREIFARAGKEIIIYEHVLRDECAVLYNQAVRNDIKLLRHADQARLQVLARGLTERRLRWLAENRQLMEAENEDPLDRAYRIFLQKLDISAAEAPIVRRDQRRIVFHSKNFCPTLEACKILDLDTKFVCRHLTELPTTELVRRIDPRLRFTRNYRKLRPSQDYCEEMFMLE
jgi:tRNA(adenine34) deaminase